MVKKGFSLEEEIIQNTFSMEMDDLKYQSLNSEEKYRSSILALYKKKLETQIEYQVNKEPGFENVKAQVIINEDAGNDKYGSIEQILLERKESSSDIKKVEIKVDSSHAESLSSRDGEYDNEAIRKVQETLCNIYDLEPDKVVIR